MSFTLFTKPKFTNIPCILFMIGFYDCPGPRKKCTTHKHFWNSFLQDHQTPFGLFFFSRKEPWSISLNLFLQMQCKGINKQNKVWHIFYGDMTFYGLDLLLHTLIKVYRIIDLHTLSEICRVSILVKRGREEMGIFYIRTSYLEKLEYSESCHYFTSI